MWDRKLKKQLKGKVLEACMVLVGNTGTDRETGEDADSRIQLGPKNMQSNPRRLKEDEGIERRDWHEKTPKDESRRKQNEMGRTYAKKERRQTVKKNLESRRGWQKKKRKTKAAMERLCQTRS